MAGAAAIANFVTPKGLSLASERVTFSSSAARLKFPHLGVSYCHFAARGDSSSADRHRRHMVSPHIPRWGRCGYSDNVGLSSQIISRELSKFPRRSPGQNFGLLRATTAVGDSALDCKWAESVLSLQEFFIKLQRRFEFRSRRAPQLLVLTATVGVVIMLAMKSVGSLVAWVCVGMGVFCLGLVVEYENYHSISVKAIEQLEIFTRVISKVACDLQRIFARILLSRSIREPERVEKAETVGCGEDWLTSEARGSRASSNSNREDLVVGCMSDMDMVVTSLSQSVAHLTNIISSMVVVADNQSLIAVRSGIDGLCRELQSVEAAAVPKYRLSRSASIENVAESPGSTPAGAFDGKHCHSGCLEESTITKLENHGGPSLLEMTKIPYTDRPAFDNCHRQNWQEISHPVSVQLIPIVDSPEARSFLRVNMSSGSYLDRVVVSRTVTNYSRPSCGAAGAPAVDGRIVGESSQSRNDQEGKSLGLCVASGKLHNAETPGKSLNSESVTRLETLSSKGDVEELSSVHRFLIAGHSLHYDESNRAEERVQELQRRRSSLTDPWRIHSTLCSARPKFLPDDDTWGTPASNVDGQFRELVLITNENVRAPCKDGMGNGRGVNALSPTDLWAKNAVSIITTEKLGTLMKMKASGRGSVESGGELEDNEQERVGRGSQGQHRQGLRGDLQNGAGQLRDGQQPGASNGGTVNDERRRRRDKFGAAADDNGRREIDLEAMNGVPFMDEEWSTDKRLPQRGDVADNQMGPGTSSGVTPRSRKGEESTIRAMDKTSFFKKERRGSNEEKYGRSGITSDMYPLSDGKSCGGQEIGPLGIITPGSSLPIPSQLKLNQQNSALRQSKEAQSRKFERYLDEGEGLLDQGMQGLDGQIEVGVAEGMLNEAAKLFEIAVEMDPLSLTAVGHWGNTLLVHGQLKLILSQHLRAMLPSPSISVLVDREGRVMADDDRELLEVTLQEICEECEDLLVEAGRKYRRALSLDRSDARALYNWGLALSYRGQLIAEEGGERAMHDADKVYLAAIDKFEAMLGINQDYAAGALLNWGLAMRDRSRLRAIGEKERIHILIQAQGLFQDALRLDHTYGQARGAVAACTAELKELEAFKVETLEVKWDRSGKHTRNWWQ